MPVDDWALVDTKLISLTPGEEEVAEWRNVATFTITLMPGEEEVAEWKNVATLTITLVPSTGEIAQWKLVDIKEVTLTIPIMECSIDADCPEGYICENGICVKKGVSPLIPIAIAGAAIGGIIIATKKKREKK